MTEAKRIAAYLPGDKVEEWAALTEHFGVGDSATLNILISNELRRQAGTNTKEQAIARIETALESLDAKLTMALYIAWAAYAKSGGMVAKLDVDEVKTLRDAMQELIS